MPKIKIKGYGAKNWRLWIDGKRVEHLVAVKFSAEAGMNPSLEIKYFCPEAQTLFTQQVALV